MSTSKRSTSKSSSRTSTSSQTQTSSSSTSIAQPIRNNANPNSDPNPLYNTHLQPSPPPPSATKEQLDLWERVINRRTSQLLRLNLQSHKSLYDLLFDESVSKNTARELRKLLDKLPSKKPTTVDHYVSIARYLLIGHFHHSIDQRVKPEGRAGSLSCVKEILSCIDLTYAEFVAQRLKDKEKEQEKIQLEKQQKASKPPAQEVPKPPAQEGKDNKDPRTEGENRKEQTSNNGSGDKSPMGLTTSKPSDAVIELLDDTPPASPAHQPDEQRNNDESNTNNNIKHDNNKDYSDNNGNDNNNHIGNNIRTSSNGLPLPPPPNNLPPLPASAFSAPNPNAPQSTTPLNTTKTPPLNTTKTPPAPVTKPKPKPKPPNKPPPPPPPRLAIPDNERSVTTRQLQFQRDEPPPQSKNQPTYSASLFHRPACSVVINVGLDKHPFATTSLDGPGVDDFYRRLEKWEPYWKLIHDCGLKNVVRTNSQIQYEVGCKTTRVNRCMGVNGYDKPIGASQIKFSVPLEKLQGGPPLDWGRIRGNPGKLAYNHGERRLLMRALPIKVPQKYVGKRSDTHIWPKGSFVQLNSTPLMIAQRKQQSHDHKLWKGMCHPLDLTQFVPQPSLLHDLCICTKDEIEYAIQVALLEYISPDALHDLCMDTAQLPPNMHNELSIKKLTKEEGLQIAMEYLDKDAVVLDDDDDSSKPTSTTTTNTPTNITLTFSLLCSMSMTPMTTPVRGKNCRHMQCFDLRNYLHTNATISGGRWRCAVCEDFVAVQDLVVDGMMQSILDELGRDNISGSRDKIQMSKGGVWKFMEENRLKYSKKRPASDRDEEESNGIKKKPNNGVTRQPSEVIELM